MKPIVLRALTLALSCALGVALAFAPAASRGFQAELFALLAFSLLVGLASLHNPRVARQRD